MTSGPLWELEPDECVLILRNGTLVCIRAHNTCQPPPQPQEP